MCKNHQSQFWQNVTRLLLVSHSQTWLHSSTDGLDHTVQNQLGSNLVLADCVRFWPDGSSLEASQCARLIQPASGQRFRADLDQIRHVYWATYSLKEEWTSNRNSAGAANKEEHVNWNSWLYSLKDERMRIRNSSGVTERAEHVN